MKCLPAHEWEPFPKYFQQEYGQRFQDSQSFWPESQSFGTKSHQKKLKNWKWHQKKLKNVTYGEPIKKIQDEEKSYSYLSDICVLQDKTKLNSGRNGEVKSQEFKMK